MAGILLKDRSGNIGEYSSITQINSKYKDNSGNLSKHKFTRMASLYAYAVYQQTDGTYLIQKALDYIPSDNFFYFGLYESEFENLATGTSGSRWVGLWLTTKLLTVGNTYAAEDMY